MLFLFLQEEVNCLYYWGLHPKTWVARNTRSFNHYCIFCPSCPSSVLVPDVNRHTWSTEREREIIFCITFKNKVCHLWWLLYTCMYYRIHTCIYTQTSVGCRMPAHTVDLTVVTDHVSRCISRVFCSSCSYMSRGIREFCCVPVIMRVFTI